MSARAWVEAVSDSWILAASTLVASIAAAALIRLLQTSSLGTGSVAVDSLAMVPGVVLAALCVLVLCLYRRIPPQPGKTGPYFVLLVAAGTVLICSEVFAGLTTLLAQRDVLTSEHELGLWDAEHYYLWHLANALPLVDAPQTLGWDQPGGLSNLWSGSLLLMFKMLVIFPLLRVAHAGWRGFRDVAIAGYDALERLPPWAAWTLFGALLMVVTVGLVLLNAAPWLNRRATHYLGDGRAVLGAQIEPALVPAVLYGVVAAILLILLATGVCCGVGLLLARPHSLLGVAGSILFYLALLFLMLLTATAATLALLHAGLADVRPAMSDSSEMGAVLGWYAWHLTEAVPSVDAPGSLGWSPELQFVDVGSRSILLAAKVFFSILLIVPLALLVRSAAERLPSRS